MEINELLSKLHDNPNDWDCRCTIAQSYYDASCFQEAADVIASAPEIPFDEASVLFAATILGTVDRESGQGLLDQFIATHPSPAAFELKAQLFEVAGDNESAASCRSAAPGQAQAPAALPSQPAVKQTLPTPVAAPVVAVSVVPAPKSLRPPGVDDYEEEPAEVEPTADTSSDHGVEGEQVESVPALIVGEGEAVHGVEAAPNTNDKIGAIFAAVIVHVAIAFLLLLAKVATPRPQPPSITASSVASTNSDSMQNQTVTRQTQKTAASVATATQVISSANFSDFAMPEMVDTSTDLTAMSLSDSMEGFGMSMSGFGEVSNMGAIPASMRSRCSMSERMKRLRESGGEDRAERAVRKGLDFLTAQQNKETGAIGNKYKVGMTGLSLLAYLGHCETPESPKYGDSVVKAALYLMDRGLKNKGIITTEGFTGHHEAYEHAIGLYALAELYTMTKESGKEIPRLESVLKKGVEVIVDAQDAMGGWSYGFKSDSGGEDMSVAGWMVQALKASYNTGRNFPKVERTLDKAIKEYIPKIQDGNGAFKYRPGDANGKATLTGAALLSLQMWNDMSSPTYNKGLAYLKEAYKNPVPGNNYYAPYYNTQAFFIHGGPEWEAYNKAFQPRLLDAQNQDGSWTKPGAGGHGAEDSQIMNTAWGILMLEVYYRYLPTTDKVQGLKPR